MRAGEEKNKRSRPIRMQLHTRPCWWIVVVEVEINNKSIEKIERYGDFYMGLRDMVPDLFCMLQQRYEMIYVMIVWRRRTLLLFSRVDWKLIFSIVTFLQSHSLTLYSFIIVMIITYYVAWICVRISFIVSVS